jgi:hypothetical protein
MLVDHNAIVRKTLLRKGGEGHRARIAFVELISTPTPCPQRVLVLDAERLITAARIAPATRMPEPDVLTGLELLTSKGVKRISPVACHSAQASYRNPTVVACHTERVFIQKESTTTTRMSEPDVRVGPKLIANKEVVWIPPVACHTHPSTLTPKHPVACHRATPTSLTPSTVACHTEGPAIQKESSTATLIKKSTMPSEHRKAKFLRKQKHLSRKRYAATILLYFRASIH